MRLLALMENLSRRTGLAFPSEATCAARLRIHPKTIKKLLRRLKKLGLLSREIAGGGKGHRVAYRVLRPSAKREQFAPVSTGKREQLIPPNGSALLRKGEQLFLPFKDEYSTESEGVEAGRGHARAPVGCGSQDLAATVLSLLVPGGPTEKQQHAMAGPIAALEAAGATVGFIRGYLRRDLEGPPWARAERALAEWCRRAKAERETARQREAELARQCAAAAAAADQPVEPPVDPMARAVFDRVGAPAWSAYFSAVSFSRTADCLTVRTSSPSLRDYVVAHYGQELRAAADGVAVRVEVAEVESGARPAIGGGG